MSQAVATRRTAARGGNGPRAGVMPAKPRVTKPLASARPPATHRFLVDDVSIGIPGWVVDHASFRRWIHSPDVPEKSRVSFINGEVIYDISKEQVFSHVRLKTIFTTILNQLATRKRCGVFLSDGVLISHLGAQVSNNPDGTYISNESFTDETVRLIEGAEQGVTELEGSPDMVLEVVSSSSVKKDYELLREPYWNAKIREYWLVDARSNQLEFLILKHSSKGYTPVRKVGGWLKSAVFGKSFRLTAIKNQLGQPDFDLQVR